MAFVSLLLLLLPAVLAARFELANVLQSGMVMQRGAPVILWGWAPPSSGVFGAMRATTSNASTFSSTASGGDGLFRLVFPPQTEGAFDFVVSSRAIPDRCSQGPYLFSCSGWGLTLLDVVMGDVIFCGGQSNMEFTVSLVFNASSELLAANAYGGIVKVFQVAALAMSTDEPLDNVVISVPWSAASNVSLPNFSATCWFTAKSTVDGRVGSARSVPLGIIASSWGGTAVKTHASPQANAECGALYPGGNISAPGADCSASSDHAPCSPSSLYNSLISPFFAGPTFIAAAVWFQGENDANPAEITSGYYACQLSRLPRDWRAGFRSPTAHWTTVQLAPYLSSSPLAAFRSMQCDTTATITNASCAVIVDGGDPLSPIGSVHSRNKQVVGRRTSAGILAYLYSTHAEAPFLSGPRYASISPNKQGSPLSATVSFIPETVAGGLVFVPPHVNAYQNSSRCPTEIPEVTLASCGFFEILGSDGVYYNASDVSLDAGGLTLTITAAAAPGSVTVAGTRYGWAVWPVVNFYGPFGLPVVPWNVNVSGYEF